MDSGPWIETFSGKKFHLLNPHPDEVCIEDIAHALGNVCRFAGHIKRFLSVAEHSVNVSKLCPNDRLWGLLHDASEAYIGDLSRPMKRLTPVGPPYVEIESRIMRVVCEKFGLPPEMPAAVHAADNAMLMAEKRALMTTLSWQDDQSSNDDGSQRVVANIVPMCWYSGMAEAIFLDEYWRIIGDPYAGRRPPQPKELVVLP